MNASASASANASASRSAAAASRLQTQNNNKQQVAANSAVVWFPRDGTTARTSVYLVGTEVTEGRSGHADYVTMRQSGGVNSNSNAKAKANAEGGQLFPNVPRWTLYRVG